MAKKKKEKSTKKDIKFFFKFKISKKNLKYALIGTSATIFLLLLAFGIYSLTHTGRAFANIKIGSMNFSGKNRAEIAATLNSAIQEYLATPLELIYKKIGRASCRERV